MDRVWLPNLLREMAEDHGLPVAIAFARRFGGRHLYLPAQPHADHLVAQEFGLPLLTWLRERPQHFGMYRILVPKGPDQDRAARVQALRALFARPLTNDQVAAETGLHVRDVQRWRARFREQESNARQPDLFSTGGM